MRLLLIDSIIVVGLQVDTEDLRQVSGLEDTDLHQGDVRLHADMAEGAEGIIGTRDARSRDLDRHGEAIQDHIRRDHLLELLHLVEEEAMGVVIRLRGVEGGDGEVLAIAVTAAIAIGAVAEVGTGVEGTGGSRGESEILNCSHLRKGFGARCMVGTQEYFHYVQDFLPKEEGLGQLVFRTSNSFGAIF